MADNNVNENIVKKRAQTANEYMNNCRKYNIAIDASVVIALMTGWNKLQPTKKFGDGDMLALLGILEKNDEITKLDLANVGMTDPNLRGAGNGNANARVISQIIRENQSIEMLDLSNTGLDDDGMQELCDGLILCQSIKELNISQNHFGELGAKSLENALQINKSITKLNISRNALGYRSINSLLCVCKNKSNNLMIHADGNFVFEEILNSVSHGVAFLGSVVGAVVLISDISQPKYTDYHFWACFLYSFSLMFLFLSSCLFHSFFMLPAPSKIFQILDHVGIYLLIAGSYTPFLLIAMHHDAPSRVLLIAQWIFAFLGSLFSGKFTFNKFNEI